MDQKNAKELNIHSTWTKYYAGTASAIPTNMHSREVSQFIQENLKKNLWKFSTQKIQLFQMLNSQ